MNPGLRRDLRTWRFWRRFATGLLSAVGLFAVVLELAHLLFPKSAPSGPWTAAFVAVVSLIWGGIRAWPRPIQQTFSSPNVRVRVVAGDLFEQTGHLVIGMCDTFDTAIPNIIAKPSVQAQFLDRIFAGDLAEFDRRLDQALVGKAPSGTIEKQGKTARYPLGTVATLKDHARCFFCVAYTEMNDRNEARGSVEGIWRSLDALWREVGAQANGGEVAIPVIGGGQARLSQILPAQDSIRFMAMSFVFAARREKFCDGLAIVVRKSEFEALDHLEIQAFLSSLLPS